MTFFRRNYDFHSAWKTIQMNENELFIKRIFFSTVFYSKSGLIDEISNYFKYDANEVLITKIIDMKLVLDKIAEELRIKFYTRNYYWIMNGY